MIFSIFGGLVLVFGFVLLYGAPYLPTQRKQGEAALDLLNLKEGQVFYELGCGDGRVLNQAAKRGLKCVGVELNPILVVVAWVYTLRYRKQVKIKWANFWRSDISQADGIFVFLIDRFMLKLDRKLSKEGKKQLKLASYAFKIPGKKVSREKKGVFLYKY